VVKVSIIIPTHNRAALLPQAIESAKAAGADTEVIVVDDASTDETPELCKATAGVRYLRLDRNVRQAGARNAGIAVSQGKYVAFLDDDDRRLPGSLENQIELLDSDPQLAFVYGRVIFADPQTGIPTGETHPDEMLRGDLFWTLLKANFIHIPSVLARKELVEHSRLFDPSVTGLEDWLMWIRLAERGLVGAVEEPVAIYRTYTRSSGQTSSNTAAMCLAAVRAQQKALQLPRAMESSADKRREVRQYCLDALSWKLVDASIAELLEGNYKTALKDYVSALRINPKRSARPYTLKLLFAELKRRRAGEARGQGS
jgi:hypothetical protein